MIFKAFTTHAEMFEALLAGETLIGNEGTSIKLIYKLIEGGLHYKAASEDELCWKLCKGTVYPTNVQIKPKTININGFEVPKPITVPLNTNDKYWVVRFMNTASTICGYTWCGDNFDTQVMLMGIAHTTKEAAMLHATALLSFTRQLSGNNNDTATAQTHNYINSSDC